MKKLENILIIGCDGLIGSHLLQKLDSSNYNIFGTSRNSKSLNNTNVFFLNLALDTLVLPNIIFDIVIFTAGVTKAIDFKENLELCKKINVDNTIKLISKLKNTGSYFIFLSSCSVFDGAQPFIDFNEPTSPKNNYGIFKVKIEDFLLTKVSNSAIIRLTKVIDRKINFVDSWEQEFCQGLKVKIYKNHYMSPISLDDVSNAIIKLISTRATGIFQLGNNYEISYFDFALKYYKSNPKFLISIKGIFDSQDSHNSLKTHLP